MILKNLYIFLNNNTTKIKKCDYNKNIITFDNDDTLKGNISIRSVKGLREIIKSKQ